MFVRTRGSRRSKIMASWLEWSCPGTIDAVAIAAIVRSSSREPHIILVSQVMNSVINLFAVCCSHKSHINSGPNTEPIILTPQFRPPVGSQVLELPAGLVDNTETPQEAALRELREETGYTGSVALVSPVIFADPGMSNACMQLVCVEVDGDKEENQNPKHAQEDGEFIQILQIPLAGVLKTILELQRLGTCQLDCRLYALALTLDSTLASPERHVDLAFPPSPWKWLIGGVCIGIVGTMIAIFRSRP